MRNGPKIATPTIKRQEGMGNEEKGEEEPVKKKTEKRK
jgi:hypothetical protein